MRREAASIKIQKQLKGHHWKISYNKLKVSVVVIQTGIRAMACHKEFRNKKQNTAATMIQVSIWHLSRDLGKSVMRTLLLIRSNICRPAGMVIKP